MPPTRPAIAAPPASAGTLALLAAEPIAWPALCAPLATVSRVLSTRSFTPPLDEALFDCDRLFRDAARERELDEPEGVPGRDFALAPFALEPPRLDAERPPEPPPLRLDEFRPPVEPLFCPDFELPWAILASLILGLRGSGPSLVDLRERFADALDVVAEAVDALAHVLAVLPNALTDRANLLDDAVNVCAPRAPRARNAAPPRTVGEAAAATSRARDCGFLLAIVRLPSMLGVCDAYPKLLQGNPCKRAVNQP